MKHTLAKDAWKEMTDRGPMVQLLQALYKLAEIPTGKCRCDICKRVIDDFEMVYQDEENPITVCEQCYNPETDYHCLQTENRINITFQPVPITICTRTTPCPKKNDDDEVSV